jgi:hypothetical protein
MSRPYVYKPKPREERPDIIQFNSLFSQYIRKRDGNVCVLCGSKAHLTNSHLISAQLTIIRWDEINCSCQCSGCNKRHEFYPHIYTGWFLVKHGVEEYHRLCELAKRKMPLPDENRVKELYKEYTEKLGFLMGNPRT